MQGIEQSQTEVMMNVVEGYLEMLRGDLRDARLDGDLELISDLERVILQLENVSRAREAMDSGIEQVLSSGGEGRLNAEINSINEEFNSERREYPNNVSTAETSLDLGEGNNMIVEYAENSVGYPSRILSFVTGAVHSFLEQI